jgi:hypothetical protein
MQPVLAIIAGALAYGATVWVVDRVVRSIFPGTLPNLFGTALIAAGIWLLALRLVALAFFLIVVGALTFSKRHTAQPQNRSSRKSQVRSAHLEMTLDHDSGDIDGRVLRGPREGQLLSDLSLSDLLQLLVEVRSDEQSLKLLETYLDRIHPEWHDHVDPGSQKSETTTPAPDTMSRDEAYRVLGLQPGSGEEEIREAYRRLIKHVHPDKGGSAVLTAQITAARDRLLEKR